MNPEIHQGANKAFGLLFREQSFMAGREARSLTATPLWWSEKVSMGTKERVRSYRGSCIRLCSCCLDCFWLGEIGVNLLNELAVSWCVVLCELFETICVFSDFQQKQNKAQTSPQQTVVSDGGPHWYLIQVWNTPPKQHSVTHFSFIKNSAYLHTTLPVQVRNYDDNYSASFESFGQAHCVSEICQNWQRFHFVSKLFESSKMHVTESDQHMCEYVSDKPLGITANFTRVNNPNASDQIQDPSLYLASLVTMYKKS